MIFEPKPTTIANCTGSIAKTIFDRAKLPNDILVRIWNLADTEQRGKLSETEFIIAMHLLASFRSGSMRALPNNLPAGLYEAAARRGAPSRPVSSSRPLSETSPVSAIPRQFSGSGAPRTSSPLARQAYTAPTLTSQATGAPAEWAIPSQEKTQYDAQFSRLDTSKLGFVSGEQAVGFFSNSRLPENDLAQIWDLADITQTGQLNQDEFAVAMHLIRQQLSSKGPLPSTLPPNLIPPSMRQQGPPQQVPPVQAPPEPVQRPKSAADDLFGLDALTTPGPQFPQSTGGSSSITTPSAPQSTSSPPPQSQAATHFKPFVPSSSFGQSIATPQATGSGSNVSSQPKSAADEDLLGDTDPEINQKFTTETTDLANLSNSVNSLTNQMKEVQTKQVTSQQDISKVTNQKRDLEIRLSQLRSTYEQEARELKSLQDKLNTAKNDATKLQQDLAMAQHSYQNLQEQKQQVSIGLEADQKENASLKERIAQVFRETNQIKPQIEKLRSEARQQKGLVAINKKQLSTAEAEREKNKAELSSSTNEYNEATKELEDSQRELETSRAAEASRGVQPLAVASPAPSTSSMNPFFRRTTSVTSERAMAQSPVPPQQVNSPNHSAFDNFFGSALKESKPFDASEEHDTSAPLQAPSHVSTPESQAYATPNSKTLESSQLPPASQPPPPPLHSRQMTSSSLPLRDVTQRALSATLSIGVVPPVSQFGDLSKAPTPTKGKESAEETTPPAKETAIEASRGQLEATEVPASQASTPFEPPSAPPDIPGSFPSDITPAETPIAVTRHEPLFSPQTNNVGKDSPNDREAAAKNAFDAAFGGFEGKRKAPISSSAFGGSKIDNTEFPPIQELGADDEDDSDSEDEKTRGFEDNFAPNVGSDGAAEIATIPSNSFPPKPPLSRGVSSTSQLPTPNAQKSPPSYGETVSPVEEGSSRDANQFAAEYTGLLPSREDPTASPTIHSVDIEPGSSSRDGAMPTTSVTAVENPLPNQPSQPPVPPKAALDEFDSAFGDLSEAQTADDRGEDEFGSLNRESFDDFNPTFDSPVPSQAHSKAPTLDNSGFQDFDSQFSAPSQSIPASAAGAPARSGPSKDDWDAMFAGFGTGTNGDGNKAPQANGDGTTAQKSNSFLDVFSVSQPSTTGASSQKPSQTQNDTLAPNKPSLNRAVSTGTEHDDPIVKQLTGMGYSRDVSVAALEKYDYNLGKVCDVDWLSSF